MAMAMAMATSTAPTMASSGPGAPVDAATAAPDQIFPPHEKPTTDFSCAYQKSMGLQHGRLYVTQNWLVFFSQFFSTRIAVAFADVTAVRKKNTALLFPNAIEIATKEAKYSFVSFLYRDQAYEAINDAIRKASSAGGFSPPQPPVEDSSASCSSDSAAKSPRRAHRPREQSATSSGTRRRKLATQSDAEEPRPQGATESSDLRTTSSPSATGLPAMLGGRSCSHTRDVIPQPMLRETFPVGVARFFEVTIRDGCGFWEELFRVTGYTDVTIGRWETVEGCGCLGRRIEMTTLLTSRLTGSKTARVSQIQICSSTPSGGILLEIKTTMSKDVPYGECFYVQSHVMISPVAPAAQAPPQAAGAAVQAGEQCEVAIVTRTPFVRSTMFRALIERTSQQENRAFFAAALSLARHRIAPSEATEPLGLQQKALLPYGAVESVALAVLSPSGLYAVVQSVLSQGSGFLRAQSPAHRRFLAAAVSFGLLIAFTTIALSAVMAAQSEQVRHISAAARELRARVELLERVYSGDSGAKDLLSGALDIRRPKPPEFDQRIKELGIALERSKELVGTVAALRSRAILVDEDRIRRELSAAAGWSWHGSLVALFVCVSLVAVLSGLLR